MVDIVERLRIQQENGIFRLSDEHDFVGWKEAADEIERLRDEVDFQLHKRKEDAAEIKRLREAIQKITDGIYIAKHYAEKALKEKE